MPGLKKKEYILDYILLGDSVCVLLISSCVSVLFSVLDICKYQKCKDILNRVKKETNWKCKSLSLYYCFSLCVVVTYICILKYKFTRSIE